MPGLHATRYRYVFLIETWNLYSIDSKVVLDCEDVTHVFGDSARISLNPPRLISWVAPPSSWVCLSTDGSSLGNLGPVSIGGLLQNHIIGERVVNAFPGCCQLAFRSAHSASEPYPFSYKIPITSPIAHTFLLPPPFSLVNSHPIQSLQLLFCLLTRAKEVSHSSVTQARSNPLLLPIGNLLSLLESSKRERVLWDCIFLGSRKDDVQIVYQSFRFGFREFPSNGEGV
ncbi:hypothetical protein RJT34_30189 [Clitoria ternatea]|uniref:Uncharacterized protein n=1 Tax=Clitoria ternatea TaxID=43366 RepID=A0AAN9I2E7_CLITE